MKENQQNPVKKPNEYFTNEVQNAILAYVKTNSLTEKNTLYKEIIGPKLKELIDNVVQVYKFGSLPNISFLKEECLLYLIAQLSKFEEDKISKITNKKSKAFTYFTVVSKHWFFASYKKHKKRKYEEINIDDLYKSGSTASGLNESRNDSIDEIITYNEYDLELERYEFKEALLKEINLWKDQFKNDLEFQKTINSVYTLIENINEIEFFNKKGIFVYLRELTGLETKEISAALKKIAVLFRAFKNKWDDGKI